MDAASSIIAFWIFAVGAAVGSFLNVCIDRLPGRASIVSPPSHCPACGRRLAPFDLIPLLSYLLLRGRCRYCGAPIPRRVLLVESVTGLLFVLLWYRAGSPPYGLSLPEDFPRLLLATLYTCFFIVIFFIRMTFVHIFHPLEGIYLFSLV